MVGGVWTSCQRYIDHVFFVKGAQNFKTLNQFYRGFRVLFYLYDCLAMLIELVRCSIIFIACRQLDFGLLFIYFCLGNSLDTPENTRTWLLLPDIQADRRLFSFSTLLHPIWYSFFIVPIFSQLEEIQNMINYQPLNLNIKDFFKGGAITLKLQSDIQC